MQSRLLQEQQAAGGRSGEDAVRIAAGDERIRQSEQEVQTVERAVAAGIANGLGRSALAREGRPYADVLNDEIRIMASRRRISELIAALLLWSTPFIAAALEVFLSHRGNRWPFIVMSGPIACGIVFAANYVWPAQLVEARAASALVMIPVILMLGTVLGERLHSLSALSRWAVLVAANALGGSLLFALGAFIAIGLLLNLSAFLNKGW